MTKNTIQAVSTLFAVLVLIALPVSFAHAADEDAGGFSPDTSASTGWYDTGSGYTPAASTGWYDTGSGYAATDANTGWYDVGSGYTPTDSYSSGYTGSGYSTGGYTSGGYTSGGYVSGGYVSGHSYSVATTPSNTNIYAPSTNNTCTNNSCNHDDHSVVNISNPAPVINNNNVVVGTTQTATQYCASGYYGTYPNCYLQQAVYNTPVVYQHPIAYANTPYVSLSQVPYTGLDLGFWGSIAYWGAFVLFALFAAYLIAVKRVQNTIANSMKAFLFGSVVETTDDVVAAPAAEVEAEVVAAPVAVAEVTNADVIDSFIMSQVNRVRLA